MLVSCHATRIVASIGKDKTVRNNIGKFQLELYREGQDTPTVMGTDGIHWADRRWTVDRARDYVAGLARDYCERHNSRATMKLEWRGTVYRLDTRRSVKI